MRAGLSASLVLVALNTAAMGLTPKDTVTTFRQASPTERSAVLDELIGKLGAPLINDMPDQQISKQDLSKCLLEPESIRGTPDGASIEFTAEHCNGFEARHP